MYACVFIVCPLIHTVFSVLDHPALVQIHFSWSVSFLSFFHPGQSVSVSLISCHLDKRFVAMVSSLV